MFPLMQTFSCVCLSNACSSSDFDLFAFYKEVHAYSGAHADAD